MDKKCYRCKDVKSLDHFGKDRHNKDGLRGVCKPCSYEVVKKYREKRPWSNTAWILSKLGDKPSSWYKNWYEEKLKKQNNKCAICQKELNDNHRPHADHCHDTFKPRGVLCKQCNLGLGNFQDNVSMLRSAIDYLNSYVA